MKKYILLAALSLMAGSSFANKTKTDTKFGDPNNKCSGSSICYIATTTSASAEFVPVDWELNSDETLLTMTLSEDVMDRLPEEVYTDIKSGYFNMNSSFTFPAAVVRAMQGVSDIVLAKGRYSVVHSGTLYVVTFHL
jgi:hypothetical protein